MTVSNSDDTYVSTGYLNETSLTSVYLATRSSAQQPENAPLETIDVFTSSVTRVVVDSRSVGATATARQSGQLNVADFGTPGNLAEVAPTFARLSSRCPHLERLTQRGVITPELNQGPKTWPTWRLWSGVVWFCPLVG